MKSQHLRFCVATLLASCAHRSLPQYETAPPAQRDRFKQVKLPFEANTYFKVSQGAFGKSSHSESGNEYSWDFDVPYGTAVLAVESGSVLDLYQPGGGGGCNQKYSNFAHNIKILHDDGSVAQYVHVRPVVSKGQRVHVGQMIAVTAENGWICRPQLHFGIYSSMHELYDSPTRRTVPVKFEGLPNGLALEGIAGVVPRYPQVVEQNWLSKFKVEWEIQSPGKTYSVTRVPSPASQGADSLRFELRKDEAWLNRETPTLRSEVATKEFVPMGSERWYGFSLFMPKDFPIEKNRLVLAQWWALTKKYLGEVNRSPILQLRFSEGILKVLMRRYPDRIVTDAEKYIEESLYQDRKFELGRWHDFIFHVKWSHDTDGFIEAWLAGKKVIDFEGMTENQDDVGPTFKFGLYRDASDKTYVSYVRNVRVGQTYESVDPSDVK